MTTFLLLFGLNDVAFSTPLPLARSMMILAAAVGTGVLFVRHSVYSTPQPVLPIHLLGNQSILSGCLINFCACFCFTIAEFFLPVQGQLHGAQTDNNLQASLILLPLSAGGAAGSMGAGVFLRHYRFPRALNMAGFGLIFVSNIIQATLIFPLLVEKSNSAVTALMITSTFCCGFGFGVLMTSSLVSVLQSLTDNRDSALVTSLLFTFRSFGSALGLTLSSLVCQEVLHLTLGDPSPLVNEDILRRVLQSPLAIFDLPLDIGDIVLSAYYKSIAIVFYSSGVVAVTGLLLGAFF
jgi:hypothetical protein